MLIDSVRASADGQRQLSYLVALAFGDGGGGNQVWINIAKVGEWNGHPRGPFQFTPAVFDQIIANAKSRVTPINCDYEHQTFKSLTGAIPSSGRILEVQRRGDDLWALAELTDRAAQMVRSGEYRTCSPVIEFEAKDRVSGNDIGPELLSLALTNDPFQDGLHPIKLTRIAMADEKPVPPVPPEDKTKATQMAAPAGVPAGAVPAVVHVVPATATPMADATAEPVPMADPPPPPPAADDGGTDVDAGSVFDAIAEAAGVDKATVLGWMADNLDKLVSQIQAGAAKDGTQADNSKAMSRIAQTAGDLRALKVELRVKDKTVVELTNQVKALSGRLESVEKKHLDEKTASMLAHVVALQKTGYVGPEKQDVDDAVFLFSQDFDRASRTYGRQIVPVGKLDADPERNDKATGPVTLSNLTEKERATVAMMIDAGVVQDKALQKITERRAAGKGN